MKPVKPAAGVRDVAGAESESLNAYAGPDNRSILAFKPQRSWFAGRWQQWLNQRIPASNTLVLQQKSIFILPSWQGVLFAISLLAMFIGGVNYINSLVLGLTFFLIALGLVTILHTYRNLQAIRLQAITSEAGFEGDEVLYRVGIRALSGQTRESIQLAFINSSRKIVDVPVGSDLVVDLFVPAEQRGVQRPGRLLIQTFYPLGLVRAWSWVDLDMVALVYPKPQAGPTPIASRAASDKQALITASGGDDFAGLRTYQDGDRLSQVHWRSISRGAPLMTKQFEQNVGDDVWLSLSKLDGVIEERLRVLCYWVLRLSRTQVCFGIELGGTRLPVGSGPEHTRRCLETLALYGLPPAQSSLAGLKSNQPMETR